MASTTWTPELLAQISRLLDAALDVPAAMRSAWIDSRTEEDPAAIAHVRRMLVEREAFDDDYLDMPCIQVADDIDGDALEGQMIGPYRLVETLGRGGMGTVHIGERVGGVRGHLVAVKILRRGMDTDEIVARFQREREILAQLKHPHITRLIDGGATESGRAWFAMELVNGQPITAYCDERKATLAERVALFRAVCEAVQHAHRNLIVHRDLKPSNILVDAEGHAKLLDFGIAKLLTDGPDASTQAHPFTREYASPEQMAGAQITTATDIYQLGLVLYELLCGRRAFTAGEKSIPRLPTAFEGATDDAISVLAAARRLPVASLRKSMRGDLDKIVQQALNAEPTHRYESAAAFAQDLTRWLNGLPVQAAGDSRRYKINKFLRRHFAASLMVGLLAVGMIAATVIAVAVAQRERAQRQRADAVAGFLESVFRTADPRVGLKPDTRVADLLQSATTMLRTDERLGADVRIRLLLGIGRSLQSLLQYPQARAAFLDANRLARDAGLEVKRAEVAVALAYADLEWGNRSFVAVDSSETGIAEWSGRSSLLAAMAHIAMGFNASNEENPERCEEQLAAALELRAQLERYEPDVIPTVLLVRGENFTDLLRFEQADAVLRDAVNEHERIFGAEHPQTLRAELGLLDNELSLHHLDIEKPVQAVIASLSRVLGPAHHDTLSAINLLGRLYLASGQTEKALTTFQSVPAPDDNESGFNKAIGEVNIGITELRLGRDDAARKNLSHALQALPDEDANSEPAVYALAGIAEIDCVSLRDASALDRLRSMHAEPADKLRDAAGMVGLALATCLHARDRDADAAALLPDVISQLRERVGPRHSDTRSAEALLQAIRDERKNSH